MATRLYLGNKTAPDFTPSLINAWNVKTSYDVRGISTIKEGSAFTTIALAETDALIKTHLVRQYITDPLEAGIVFSTSPAGTVKFQIKCMESDAGANLKLAVQVTLYLDNGDWQDTVYNGFPANNTEMALSLTNRGALDNQIADYVTVGGERLSIEIGYRAENTSTDSYTGSFEVGDDSANDLPEDDVATVQYCPWIEFSQTLAFTGESASPSISPSISLSVSPSPSLSPSLSPSVSPSPSQSRNPEVGPWL